jgi:hypothetical protein
MLSNSWCLERVDSQGEKQGQQVVNLAKVWAKEGDFFRLKSVHNSLREHGVREGHFTPERSKTVKPGFCRM